MEAGKKIAIIGNGCAGAECLKALRESGYTGEIHIFTDNQWPVANPMLTTYYVAGKIDFPGLFPYGNGDEIYQTYRADVHPDSPVIKLDASERVVANQGGFELQFDQCLIAAGAAPFLPPIPGIDSNKVYVMRTVEDAVRLKEVLAQRPQKALIIGASMVGIKLVETFYKAGLEVTLADLAEYIFPLAAHRDCAEVIEDRLVKKGIKLKFGAAIKKIEETAGGIKAYFGESPEGEAADFLVMCIGVRANINFIDRGQIQCQQGVLVDKYMRTNVPGVYAAGDVAQGTNLLTGEQQIIGLWANGRYQGRTAGRNMAGLAEALPGNIPHNITHFMGMDFVGIGDVRNYTRTEKRYDGQRFSQLFWQDERLTGANFVDDYTSSGALKTGMIKALLQNTPAPGYSAPVMQNILIDKILMEVEKGERC
ncbi:MAG: NAD(P)/FAD-dependent oxidoreductase [Peptococcaceae bacterium]